MGYETVISFFAATLLVLFCGWLFSLKTKGLFKILLNTAVGAFLLLALSFLTPLNIPLNPLNAFIVGLLGLPGAALVIIIVLFL